MISVRKPSDPALAFCPTDQLHCLLDACAGCVSLQSLAFEDESTGPGRWTLPLMRSLAAAAPNLETLQLQYDSSCPGLLSAMPAGLRSLSLACRYRCNPDELLELATLTKLQVCKLVLDGFPNMGSKAVPLCQLLDSWTGLRSLTLFDIAGRTPGMGCVVA